MLWVARGSGRGGWAGYGVVVWVNNERNVHGADTPTTRTTTALFNTGWEERHGNERWGMGTIIRHNHQLTITTKVQPTMSEPAWVGITRGGIWEHTG